MAITFVGDGTVTSSVAIATFQLSNAANAIPEPRGSAPRALTMETDSGMAHGWQLGQPRRRWNIALRLLTSAQQRQLATLLNTVGSVHWFTWLMLADTSTAGATSTTIDGSFTPFTYVDSYRDQVIFTTSGTGAGQLRRVTAVSNQAGINRYTIAPAWTVTPDATTDFVVGWPVRVTSDVEYATLPPQMHNADFRVEEAILASTL